MHISNMDTLNTPNRSTTRYAVWIAFDVTIITFLNKKLRKSFFNSSDWYTDALKEVVWFCHYILITYRADPWSSYKRARPLWKQEALLESITLKVVLMKIRRLDIAIWNGIDSPSLTLTYIDPILWWWTDLLFCNVNSVNRVIITEFEFCSRFRIKFANSSSSVISQGNVHFTTCFLAQHVICEDLDVSGFLSVWQSDGCVTFSSISWIESPCFPRSRWCCHGKWSKNAYYDN